MNQTIPALNYIVNRDNFTNVPDHSEIDGAAFGVARLHAIYNLDTKKMFQEGVIDTHLNLQHINSKPSIMKFSGKRI